MLVKAAFFPLANKSYASMAKMKAVQPEMTALRERYADDKVKQQQELMELYKKEKINPLAGCLPIVMQIPVFFSLYKVLFVTIEMRHAPFFGWIQDLSAPDPTNIFNLFGLIPFDPTVLPVVGHFLHLGVWPLIMGITMWVQMKLNPAPPDPTQKMIFDWMPLIFTFMLATFPAGLVIYWAWNNIAVGAAAERHHAQARRQDRTVRQHRSDVQEEAASDCASRATKYDADRRLARAIEAGAREADPKRNKLMAQPTSPPRDRDRPATVRRRLAVSSPPPARSTSLPPMRGIEIAFAGRSNVGKSSLINALTGRKALARTSHTPGRTQELNFFTGGGRLHAGRHAGLRLCRAPPRAKVAAWTALIHAYLRGRANLARVYVLVDARHGLKDSRRRDARRARPGRGQLSDRADQGRRGEAGASWRRHRRGDDGGARQTPGRAFPDDSATSARDRRRHAGTARRDRAACCADERGSAHRPALAARRLERAAAIQGRDDAHEARPTTASRRQARILSEALPHMQRYDEEIVVVKYGGHAMGDEASRAISPATSCCWSRPAINPVVVHGGGPQIGAMLKKLGIKSEFADGLRVTDEGHDRDRRDGAGRLDQQADRRLHQCRRRQGRRPVRQGRQHGAWRARSTRTVVDPGLAISRRSSISASSASPTRSTLTVLDQVLGTRLIPVLAPVATSARRRDLQRQRRHLRRRHRRRAARPSACCC